jgi:hypothetical protein
MFSDIVDRCCGKAVTDQAKVLIWLMCSAVFSTVVIFAAAP